MSDVKPKKTYSPVFDNAYKDLLGREGGYRSKEEAKANGDTGGETYKGISWESNRNWPGWDIIKEHKKNGTLGELDMDTKLDALVKEQYYEKYWPKELDKITDPEKQHILFDSIVNGSPELHKMFVQRALSPDAVDQNNFKGKLFTQENIDKINNDPDFAKTMAQKRVDWLLEERPSTGDSHGLFNRYVDFIKDDKTPKEYKDYVRDGHKALDNRALEEIDKLSAKGELTKKEQGKLDLAYKAVSDERRLAEIRKLYEKDKLTPAEEKRLNSLSGSIKGSAGKKELKNLEKQERMNQLHKEAHAKGHQLAKGSHSHNGHICTGVDCTGVLGGIRSAIEKLKANIA